MTFEELGLKGELLKAIEEMGFIEPSAIQEKSIPVLLEDEKDYVGLAQTGTGKTAAFGLPMIQHIDPLSPKTQAIVLCPTRELCLQIAKELENFSKYVKGVKVTAVYGGAAISEQIRKLKSGSQIVVGTPGRTKDLINRKAIHLSTVRIAVLDEADEMLNMGFKEDITTILSETPEHKSTWLFSATMPKEVERIANDFMTNPFKVTIGSQNSSAENIQHCYCVVAGRDMYDALKRFIDASPELFGILFCRTRRTTKEITEKLLRDGYDADALHGDLSQQQRDMVMQRFRSKNVKLLVATDVASRGIDVDDVTHVFHLDLPDEIENYTHRSGRTARAGKSGISIAILGPRDSSRIKQIERVIKKPLKLLSVPTGDEIRKIQLSKVIDKIINVKIDEQKIKPFMSQVIEGFKDLSKEDVIKHFISLEFNRYLTSSDHDINREIGGKDKKDRSERTERTKSANRLFINIGKKDGVGSGELLKLLCEDTSLNGRMIGRIDLMEQFSFFEVESKNIGEEIISVLNDKEYMGRKLRIEFSQDKADGGGGGKRFRPKGRPSGGGGRPTGGGGRRDSSGGYGGDSRNRRERFRR